MNIGPDSERQRENGTKQTIRQTWVGINRCFHFPPLKSTLPNHHTSITRSTVLQLWVISSEHFIISSVPLHHLPPLLYQLMTLPLFSQTKLERSVVSFHLHSHRTSNHIHCSTSHLLLLSPPWGRSIQTSPLQPSYSMSSRPNPLAPSPSNLFHTLTSTHTHYQHISPHRYLPRIQAGSGNTTAQKKLYLQQTRLL